MTRHERSKALKSSLKRVKRKKIQGTEATFVYENGVVLNEKTGYATTGTITGQSPYPKVTISYRDGSQRRVEVQRLMGELYLKANWKVNENKIVAFKDGTKTNTILNNLILTTRTKNMRYNSNVLGKRIGRITNDEVFEIRKSFKTYVNPKVGMRNIAKRFNISTQTVSNIVNKVTYANVR